MELRTSALRLEILPYAKADKEDWAKVKLNFVCNGFQGNFVGWIQTSDIRRFQSELSTMYGMIDTSSKARLCSAEADFDIELRMDARGHIVGRYIFESERINGTPTALSGELEMDQSFLPELIKQVEELASSLSPAAA